MESLFLVGCTILAATGAVAVKIFTNARKLDKLRKQQAASGANDEGSEDLEKEIDKIVNTTK